MIDEIDTKTTDMFGSEPAKPLSKSFPDWHASIDAICKEFLAQRGQKFEPSRRFFRDLKAVEALSGGDLIEVLRRWRIALRSTHPVIGELSGLVARWNQFATPEPRKEQKAAYDPNQGITQRPAGAPDSCAVCGGLSSGVVWGHHMCAAHYADWMDSGAGKGDTDQWIQDNMGPA